MDDEMFTHTHTHTNIIIISFKDCFKYLNSLFFSFLNNYTNTLKALEVQTEGQEWRFYGAVIKDSTSKQHMPQLPRRLMDVRVHTHTAL